MSLAPGSNDCGPHAQQIRKIFGVRCNSFVGLPSERTLGSRPVCLAMRANIFANLIFMKGEDHIRPTGRERILPSVVWLTPAPTGELST